MNAIMTGAAVLAGKEVFKKVIADIYDYCTKESGLKLKQWWTERQIETLYKRISQIRKVKTIWQIDKTVDLFSFYCDSHIVINEKRKIVAGLSDFETDDNILIQGIAGQGKSIFLRYLCAVELAQGKTFPLFVELRKISRESPLLSRIYAAFGSLGVLVDHQLFPALAGSGKVLLLLDAFDEVPDQLKSQVIADIEDLAAMYQNMRIIVTSRPYENIRFSNHFTVARLDDLKGEEYCGVIEKIAGVQARNLLDHIEKRAQHVKDLLCTPLMVTLLVLSYKSYQQLPTKLSDFYDSLFETLLQRHDGTKPGFTRQRGCEMDDNQYRQVFEALCILTKKKERRSLSANEMYELSNEALRQCDQKSNPKAYLDDIVKITCLVIRDGGEHRFIHKTVQEYYAASYVQKKPDKWASDFYSRLLKRSPRTGWNQELEFLCEIDNYRYNRYFYLPAVFSVLPIREEELDEIESLSADVIAAIADGITLSFLQFSPPLSRKSKSGWMCRQIQYNDYRNFVHFQIVEHACTVSPLILGDEAMEFSQEHPDLVSSKELHEANLTVLESDKGPVVVIELGTAIRNGGFPSVLEQVQFECMQLIKQAISIRNSLKADENPSLLDGLI